MKPQRSVNSHRTGQGGVEKGRVARGTTAVNRGQKGIRASETERNRVFVALLPGSRLGPPLSARVCPAQTLFLQIEPHVPPFTLYPFSFYPLPPTLSFSCLSLPLLLLLSLSLPSFLSFFSPSSVRHSRSLSLPPPSSRHRPSFARLHGTHTPLRTHATGGKV